MSATRTTSRLKRVQEHAQRALRIGVELLLGHSWHLEICLVELLSLWCALAYCFCRLDRAFSSRSVWNAQKDYRAEYVGPQDCGVLSNQRAQVLACDHCLFVAEDMYQPNHITNKLKLRLFLNVRRSVGLTVAAHIRGHCVVTGSGQRGHDGTGAGYSSCVVQVNWNRTKTIFPITT